MGCCFPCCRPGPPPGHYGRGGMGPGYGGPMGHPGMGGMGGMPPHGGFGGGYGGGYGGRY